MRLDGSLVSLADFDACELVDGAIHAAPKPADGELSVVCSSSVDGRRCDDDAIVQCADRIYKVLE